jgi:hypothetical protein
MKYKISEVKSKKVKVKSKNPGLKDDGRSKKGKVKRKMFLIAILNKVDVG